MFKRVNLYYLYPPFDAFIDEDGTTILQRYICAQAFKIEDSYAISFTIEEKCESPNGKQFFRQLFTDVYRIDEVPEKLHVSIVALSRDEVSSVTSELFVQSLFFDICQCNPAITWVDRYFPKWKELTETDTDTNQIKKQLLEMQRRIQNGEFNDPKN